MLIDIHSGPSGAVGAALKLFANATTKGWGAMNLETNCGDHTVRRMLEEAADMNDWMACPNPQLHGRAASFCTERSGFNEGGLNDQGVSFFLPNMTWLQPPGWVHAMIAQTWQPNNLAVSFSTDGKRPAMAARHAVSAQGSDDGRTVVVRVVNGDWGPNANTTAAVTVHGLGAIRGGSTSTISYPSLSGANTPSQPTLVAPIASSFGVMPAGNTFLTPAHSYTVFTFHLA